MIETQLAAGFERQLAVIAEDIANSNGFLQLEENRDDAERLRVRLKYLAKLDARVKAAQLEIFAAANAIEEMEARFTRWRAIADESRQLEAEMQRLELEFPRLAAACLEPENDVRVAAQELSNLKNEPLHTYPTEKEKRERRDEIEKLKAALAEKTEALKTAARAREHCRGAWMIARDKLAGAQFRERQLRLPADAAPFKGVGELSAVS